MVDAMTGWKNDTAASASLLIDNDQGLLNCVNDMMRLSAATYDRQGHDVFNREEYVRFDLEEWLKLTLVGEPTEAVEGGLLRQGVADRVMLAIHAFAEDCDFAELARHYMDVAKEEEE